MRKGVYFLLLITATLSAQKQQRAFKGGEFLKYRISYGLLNAGLATFDLEETTYNNRPVFHIKGLGWSTGMVNFFFPVYDDYQSYFDLEIGLPYRFVRNIKEGGYTKNVEIFFNHQTKRAKVVDHKKNNTRYFQFTDPVHDMLSSLYFVRSIDFSQYKKGDIIKANMFYDNRENNVQLMYLGREVIKTKFGKVRTLAFKPIVEEGRIFSDEEGVKLWLTDDHMKIPVKAKAAILVGSLKMELFEYRGINGYLPVISPK